VHAEIISRLHASAVDGPLDRCKRLVFAAGGGRDFARLPVAGSGRCNLFSDPLPADLVGGRSPGYAQPVS